MKKGIHPETYRLVAFKDMSNDTVFVTRSCAPSKETLTVEGVEYPLVKLEISNTSHPFYTGKVKLVDTAGRVDMFYQRYKSHGQGEAGGHRRSCGYVLSEIQEPQKINFAATKVQQPVFHSGRPVVFFSPS